MIVRVYVNDIEVNDPLNLPELEVNVNYDQESESSEISITDFVFGVSDLRNSNDGFTILNNIKKAGLTGGSGVTEGVKLRVDLDGQRGVSRTLFNGYLDLWSAKYDIDTITATAIEYAKLDWLNQEADKFTFEYLVSIGVITSSDYIAIPYTISKKQNALEIIIAIVTIYTMVQQLIQAVNKAGDVIGDISGVMNCIGGAIKLALLIVYIVILVLAIIKMCVDLYNYTIQPVKFHYGMSVFTLLTKGCEHLGITLSSSILDKFKNMIIMPEKYNLKESNQDALSEIVGNLDPNQNESNGFYKGTFGQLIREVKTMFNSKVIMRNNTLYIEPYNFTVGQPKYVVPPIENYKYELNHEDFKSNYAISFAVDFNDKNTVQEYLGTKYQVITTPIGLSDKRLRLTKGLQDVRINFALTKRKTEFNFIEEVVSGFIDAFLSIANAIIDAINFIIDIINAILKAIKKVLSFLGIKINIPEIPHLEVPGLTNPIQGRIGLVKMESDFVDTPKIMLLDINKDPRYTKLSSNNEDVLNAKYLYENYHYFRSFIPKTGFENANQYVLPESIKTHFTFDDYENTRDNKLCTTSDGEKAEIISFKFNPITETATLKHKINKLYTKNLTETIIYPDGK